jgi:hypothetical protein
MAAAMMITEEDVSIGESSSAGIRCGLIRVGDDAIAGRVPSDPLCGR